jgi:hypothetical protein
MKRLMKDSSRAPPDKLILVFIVFLAIVGLFLLQGSLLVAAPPGDPPVSDPDNVNGTITGLAALQTSIKHYQPFYHTLGLLCIACN